MNTDIKKAYSIESFCQAYEIGRSKAFQEIEAGRLRAVKSGARTLIPAEAADQWLKSLPVQENRLSIIADE